MTEENHRKASGTRGNEYINRVDRRHRTTERLLNAPYVDSNNLGTSRVHEKDHVQFRISPFAKKVGDEVAALFGMSLSQYAKACLYLNLGLTAEPIDRRKKPRTSRKRE